MIRFSNRRNGCCVIRYGYSRGEEEAELIFLGVSHALAANDSRRLVIDIGGGSTEFCVGGSFDPQHATSVDLGCVTLTDRCLSGDVSLAEGLCRGATRRVRVAGADRRWRGSRVRATR